jgi:Na+/proline symporter
MTTIVLIALAVSISLYLGMGLRYSRDIRGLGDILPLLLGRRARVENHREFAASTVAATISLATVIVAFFELVPALGLWLLWTAITTALGLLVFSILVPRIWTKMSGYDYRPTIHAYLGTEFDNKGLALVASVCTAIGYLSAFAVELTVGSRFLAGLVHGIPPFLTVAVIATVAFTYTGLGGFRVVVVTDRIQMWFIWLLIAAMAVFYAVTASAQGWALSVNRIPLGLRTLQWNIGLLPFILGIAIMNLLTFVSNMGLWQRVAGSQKPQVVTRGMWSSVVSAGVSWSLLVLIAVGAFMFITPVDKENVLVTILKFMQRSPLGRVGIFFVVLGLYGAMLSTASTQLIAVSHTLYEDVIAQFRKVDVHRRAELQSEAFWSRFVLVVSALAAVGMVELLRVWGFTIADLAFAVYGAALGLVPPIIFTLFASRAVTRRLSMPATFAVAFGFISCWSAAAYGRATGNANLVFLSPIISTAVATTIMFAGLLLIGRTDRMQETSYPVAK